MRTKKIIIPIAIIVVILVGVGLSIGLTYSLWSDTTGGDTSVAPSITTYDWNSYAKYFTYTAYDSNGNVIASDIKNGSTISKKASYFSVTGLTEETLLPEVVFPQSVTYKVSSTTFTDSITEVGSTLFDDITFKSIPTKIVISPSITKVRQNAFAGLANLQSVLICASSTTDTHGIRFGYHALGNSSALKEIKCEGQLSVVFTDLACIGCTSLTTLDKGSCNLFYIQNIDTSSTTTPITSSNWTSGANYKAKIFLGAPSSLNPFS